MSVEVKFGISLSVVQERKLQKNLPNRLSPSLPLLLVPALYAEGWASL